LQVAKLSARDRDEGCSFKALGVIVQKDPNSESGLEELKNMASEGVDIIHVQFELLVK
jgi:hypothetical protein